LRYQSASITADKQKHGANYWARTDGNDYMMTGSPTYDHVSIQEMGRNQIRKALEKSKIRKRADDYVFEVQNKKGNEVIVKAPTSCRPTSRR